MTPETRLSDAEIAELLELNIHELHTCSVAAFTSLRRALRELVERREAEAWQPIETAPKDGTKVLAYGLTLGMKAHGPFCVIANFKADYNGGEMYWHWGAPGYIGQIFATHWMPIPAGPWVDAESGKEKA